MEVIQILILYIKLIIFFLDGKYTAFGKVLSGMDVADKIVNAPRDQRDNPNERIEMKIKIINR